MGGKTAARGRNRRAGTPRATPSLLLGEGKQRGSECARAESDQYFSAFAHSIIRVACIKVD
jgi:hypothetical protein